MIRDDARLGRRNIIGDHLRQAQHRSLARAVAAHTGDMKVSGLGAAGENEFCDAGFGEGAGYGGPYAGVISTYENYPIGKLFA
ncbi:hypothetical protein CORC01_13460 [Colletotrichum orchidophilum]|uniref:Uncharacterized protein n=1 Tax=Colletotrichum orchidophilum TaxID=1209926 RepID=A0A1G4AQ09_9PEZI|nr:uncharacterized protein CORC01_13460 [Colletotrichum orchidophilum]OHE91260.1 hypothetical protein CORC01_13460 [Colletotrichum orchidophilum]